MDLGVEWMARSGLPRGAVVLVGDTVHDYEVAEAMGIRCVLVAAGHHARAKLEACGCPVMDDLVELRAELLQSFGDSSSDSKAAPLRDPS